MTVGDDCLLRFVMRVDEAAPTGLGLSFFLRLKAGIVADLTVSFQLCIYRKWYGFVGSVRIRMRSCAEEPCSYR